LAASLRVTQIKSTISHIARNRATIRALGLHRIGDIVVVPDNDATRGMVRAVRFLVSVEEVEGEGRRRRGAAEKTDKTDKTDKADKAASNKTARAATARAATARAATDKAPDEKVTRQAARAKPEPVTAAEEDK
jgi:large subunit ribosomal protein L30